MENMQQRILKRENFELNNGNLVEGKIYEISGEKTGEGVKIIIRDKFTKKLIFTEVLDFPWESNSDHRSFKFMKTDFIYSRGEVINIYRKFLERKVITKRLVIN